jgi:hypothetical protein
LSYRWQKSRSIAIGQGLFSVLIARYGKLAH